ncbi:seven-hairpin glycosidase [Testicularia cyperi]|uniref:alpha-1,2-Mannosidase n=1 Tax=Testicularia cyperi TaxID=1882483 RepID=A0A317XL07_9BASI|nr:seven-hairpin glycosidase [Testicularia cyperi]
MLSKRFFVLLVGLLSVSGPWNAEAATIQKKGLTQSSESKSRADEIKTAYRNAYEDYLKYARGHDELLPVSKGSEDPFGGWGATVVDSLSTSFLMGHMDLYQDGVNYMKKVDFTQTSQASISLFETNIRYLAGLLSAYELGGKKEPKLVEQAKVVGDHLLTGWVGNNNLPFNTLRWNNFGKPDTSSGSAGIAEAGTLIIEMDRLTKFSGDSKYLNYAKKAMQAIINSKGVFPGLYPQVYNPATSQPADDYVTWGGGSDSFFEYLVKYSYMTGEDNGYLSTWIKSVKFSIKHLIEQPEQTNKKLTYLTDYSASSGGNLPRFSHLGCFAGGNWILGGQLVGNTDFLKYGLALTDGCINTYTASPSGLGPESFVFIGNGGNTQGVTINDQDFYRENGFDFEVTQYILRPEVIESLFYAYRTTGDTQYQDLAWQAWKAIKKHCKAPAAFAAVSPVNSTSPKLLDDSESFLYAETFKYLYLIFADPSTADLDYYVFNTEAHPFLIDQPSKQFSESTDIGTVDPPNQTKPKPSSTKNPQDMPIPKFSSLPGLENGGDGTRSTLESIYQDTLGSGRRSGGRAIHVFKDAKETISALCGIVAESAVGPVLDFSGSGGEEALETGARDVCDLVEDGDVVVLDVGVVREVCWGCWRGGVGCAWVLVGICPDCCCCCCCCCWWR